MPKSDLIIFLIWWRSDVDDERRPERLWVTCKPDKVDEEWRRLSRAFCIDVRLCLEIDAKPERLLQIFCETMDLLRPEVQTSEADFGLLLQDLAGSTLDPEGKKCLCLVLVGDRGKDIDTGKDLLAALRFASRCTRGFLDIVVIDTITAVLGIRPGLIESIPGSLEEVERVLEVAESRQRRIPDASDSVDFEEFNWGEDGAPNDAESVFEADLVLVAHPENRRLGTRFRLRPGQRMEIGRLHSVEVSLPEVLSISRRHALLEYRGRRVNLRDLGSTNGIFVNGKRLPLGGSAVLRSGDRIQLGHVRFKFLHERDREHAYYETIYDLVTKDILTGIYNRRHYEEEVERELARARRYGRPLTLIMFELGDLEQIRTQISAVHGQLSADFLLKCFVGGAREILRPEQFFARIGSDEFIILAPETDLEGGERLARSICDRVVSLGHDFVIRASWSFGVAQFDTSIESGAEFLARLKSDAFRRRAGDS